MERKDSIRKKVMTVLVTAFITFLLIALGIVVYLKSLPVPIYNVIRVADIIDKQYMGNYDKKQLENEVLSAVVSGLGDKYSVYYDEESAQQQFLEIDGYYYGIGIEAFANSENGKIEVISAYEGTPSSKAGIKSGDYILKIDDKEYDAATFPEAVNYMRGISEKNPLDKELTLTIERSGELLEIKLKREKIQVNNVKSEFIDGICYIKYPGFDKNSLEQTKKITDSLDESVTGIVIDLRNNPGGELNSAIDMCDLFLDEATVMYTVDKQGQKVVYTAKDGKCDLPLAVIVNGGSASAAEVFAGALQDNKRAVIVGEKTYGKGVSQSVRYINPLDKSSGAVKLTVCKNFTPNGKWMNDAITPDIEVTEDIASDIRNDAAFKAAIESIKGTKQ